MYKNAIYSNNFILFKKIVALDYTWIMLSFLKEG